MESGLSAISKMLEQHERMMKPMSGIMAATEMIKNSGINKIPKTAFEAFQGINQNPAISKLPFLDPINWKTSSKPSDWKTVSVSMDYWHKLTAEHFAAGLPFSTEIMERTKALTSALTGVENILAPLKGINIGVNWPDIGQRLRETVENIDWEQLEREADEEIRKEAANFVHEIAAHPPQDAQIAKKTWSEFEKLIANRFKDYPLTSGLLTIILGYFICYYLQIMMAHFENVEPAKFEQKTVKQIQPRNKKIVYDKVLIENKKALN